MSFSEARGNASDPGKLPKHLTVDFFIKSGENNILNSGASVRLGVQVPYLRTPWKLERKEGLEKGRGERKRKI